MGQRMPLPRPDLRGFTQYGTRPVSDAIKLNANEWPEPTAASSYLTSEELEGLLLNRYPSPQAEVRTILAERYGVRPDQLIFGNGSNDTLLTVFLLFGGHGRTTLLFDPTYAMHARLTTIAGGTPVHEGIGLPYDLTADKALAAMSRTRADIVCFCTPNNPTGTLVDDGVVLAVAERYPETLVLVDEAYSDIPGRTILPALADHPNLVVSKTFSKVHAAAGLRFGILIVHPDLAAVMRPIQFPFNVSVVTYALAARIARDEAGVRRRIELLRGERERVYEALRRIPGIEVYPSEGNFLLFKIGGDTAKAHARFAEQGVLIRDMSPWAGAEGCLRVSIGTLAENDKFIQAAGSVFATVPA